MPAKILALWFLFFTVSLTAQNPSAQFFVTTKTGEGVADLRAEELTVLEPKSARISIANVAAEPMCMGLLLDTSNSSRWSSLESRRAVLEQAGMFFRAHLRKGKDLAFVQMFDTQSEILQEFTDDPDLLIQSFSRLTVGGGTALHDAVFIASKKLDQPKCVRRILVLASDGGDNQSAATPGEALAAALKARVGIFAMSLQEGEIDTRRGWAVLRKLSGETGGAVLEADTRKFVEKSFKLLSGFVSGTYLLQLDLSPDAPTTKSFAVKVIRKGVVVRVPKKLAAF